MPEYFSERMAYIWDENTKTILPDLAHPPTDKPVLLFHGNKDVMVKDQDIYRLYKTLPVGKRIVEYANEGHCCNFKLNEIRQASARWFLEDTKMTFEHFRGLVSEIAKVPEDLINEGSSFRDDLGIDSLQMVNLFTELTVVCEVGMEVIESSDDLMTAGNLYQALQRRVIK
jgi:acyl carrier protein